MEAILKPEKFKTDPSSPTASKEWVHWLRTFENFISSITPVPSDDDKLRILINHLSFDVDEYVSNCDNYNNAISVLRNIFVKPVNEVYARHKLAVRHQLETETIDQYVEVLKSLSKDCQFKTVSAETNRDDFIRDAFINGLQSSAIRQRLLERSTLTLVDAYDLARSLELAQQQTLSFHSPQAVNSISQSNSQENQDIAAVTKYTNRTTNKSMSQKCYFCGYTKHSRVNCPARNLTCNTCGKRGHFSKVCNSAATKKSKQHDLDIVSGSIEFLASSGGLAKSTVPAKVNGKSLSALIDTGSTLSFINDKTASKLGLHVSSSAGAVSMASTSIITNIVGQCKVDISVHNYVYKEVNLFVLPDLCSDIIIGLDLLKRHSSVQLVFGGNDDPLTICSVAVASVRPASLFSNIKQECKPIAIKSRRHSLSDYNFIKNEVANLLKEDVIESSLSPWRAQVLVISNDNRKKRMVIDYSQTINRYTYLDAYPLPRIDEIVNKVANYRIFSTIDLKSAYHQIPIREEDTII